MAHDDFAAWNALLDGQPYDLDPYRVQLGYWRLKDRDGQWIGVHTWRQPDGQIAATVGRTKYRVPCDRFRTEQEMVEQLFQYCARHPVETEAFEHWQLEDEWPDSVPDVQEAVAERVGSNAPDHVIVAETVAELRAEAESWLKEIGGVTTQEHADKAANFASRFAELEKEAKDKHRVQKEPHLEAGRQVDATWKPVQASADEAKRWAKGLTTEFLRQEQARKLAEATEKANRGEVVRPADTRPKVGTRGARVSLRTKRVGVVTDPAAFAAYLVSIKSPDLMAVLNTVATRIAHSGGDAPGVAVNIEQAAA